MHIVCTHSPISMSHNLIVPSFEPLSSNRSLGANFRLVKLFVSSLNMCSHVPLFKFQILGEQNYNRINQKNISNVTFETLSFYRTSNWWLGVAAFRLSLDLSRNRCGPWESLGTLLVSSSKPFDCFYAQLIQEQ